MAEQVRAVEIFYSYAHEDQALRDELEKRLETLRRLGQITGWHDREIQAGTEREKEIEAHLNAANIVLLLISPDFISSDYCYNVVMPRALERHKAGQASVIPIILRPTDLEGTPIAKLSALPTDGKPVTIWSNLDEAFLDVAKGIRKVIKPQQTEGESYYEAQCDDKVPGSNEQTLRLQQKSYPTINRREAVDLFRRFMQSGSQIRIIRLQGEANMGKSHLLTKVFPVLARQEYQARCAIIDLRKQTISDILNVACIQFGAKSCNGYYAAHQEQSNRPKTAVEDALTHYASLDISKNKADEAHYRGDHYLVEKFVNDMDNLNDKLLLLLFDSINNAIGSIQTWLMDTFLVYLPPLDHVRVIVAGSSLPEAYSSYSVFCETYQLQPVRDEKEFIEYCRNLNVNLVEQSIRDFAKATNYAPGLFVGMLPNFMPQRISNG